MEVLHADPAARRRAIVWIVIVLAVVGGFAAASERLLDRLSEWVLAAPDDSLTRLGIVLAGAVAIVAVPAVAVAIRTLGLARRTLAAERFPPPGAVVWRDTRILTGNAARWRGRLLRYTSYVLLIVVLAAIYQGIQLWRLIGS